MRTAVLLCALGGALAVPSSEVLEDQTDTLVNSFVNSFFNGMSDDMPSGNGVSIEYISDNSPDTTISVFRTPITMSFGRSTSLFGDDMFSPFNGLFQNIDSLFSRMSSLSREVEQEQEEDGSVSVEDTPDDSKSAEEVKELKSEMEMLQDRIGELEEMQELDDNALLEASWGVNADALRTTCMPSFETLCPESVPEVFYHDIHPYPPPGPHLGLGPKDKDTPCWMQCVKDHGNELPFECSVSATRMMNWIDAHGDDQYVEDPRMVFFGALLHFIIMMLLISACVRCTCLFVKMRRRRAAERMQKHGEIVIEATVVKA